MSFFGYSQSQRELVCHGCAHSIAAAPYPGGPSGERPCGFCVRNPSPRYTPLTWYDGKTPPFETPMDCYIATDRLQQQRIFDELARLEREGRKAPPRERYDAFSASPDADDAWCCDGGDGPSGHTWTCWRWLGISFG